MDIYEPKYVAALFDKMSKTYKRMNYITSFGFSERWRKQCVEAIDIEGGSTVLDLMTGMGECWASILNHAKGEIKLIGLDFSEGMLQHAALKKAKLKKYSIEILQEDVFHNSIETASIDYIISEFGLKTFSSEQLEKLAIEMNRLMKAGGSFSLVDVSVPNNKLFRIGYLFYLKRIIPILGWLFLGNPETYKMLGIYTEKYKNSKELERIFKKHDFEVDYMKYFFGCASGIKGKKLNLP